MLSVVGSTPLEAERLTAGEWRQYRPLVGSDRGREWLTGRRALRTLVGILGYGADTSPYTFPHRRFSLSHTGGRSVAAGVVGPGHPAVAGLGVDIELPRPVDPRTIRFFLRQPEIDHVLGTGLEEHLRLWTVKEALFKADPANRHTAYRDYSLLSPAASCGVARRDSEPLLAFAYCTGRVGEAHLSVAAALRATARHGRNLMPESTINFDEVIDRICTVLNIDAATLTTDTVLRDLVRESFTLVELVINLQEEFGATFGQAELREVVTLGDLADLLRVPVHLK